MKDWYLAKSYEEFIRWHNKNYGREIQADSDNPKYGPWYVTMWDNWEGVKSLRVLKTKLLTKKAAIKWVHLWMKKFIY